MIRAPRICGVKAWFWWLCGQFYSYDYFTYTYTSQTTKGTNLYAISSHYHYTYAVIDVFILFLVQRCSGRLYLQLFVGGLMSYLYYLCLSAHSGVQHILCCVFVLFFFVLCILCCQFVWIVHFLIATLVVSNVYLSQIYPHVIHFTLPKTYKPHVYCNSITYIYIYEHNFVTGRYNQSCFVWTDKIYCYN